MSVKIGNDEAEILDLVARVQRMAQHVRWAVDILGAPSALLLTLLGQAGQSVRYASGRVVAAMSAAFTGEGKTDAKDADVIAQTARMRHDLTVIDARRPQLRRHICQVLAVGLPDHLRAAMARSPGHGPG